MNNQAIFEMADRLKAAKEMKKDLESQVKEVNAEIETLNHDLSLAMAEEQVDKFSRNGSTFYLHMRLYASPAAGMKDELMQRLKDHGYGSIVTETVNANTLSSFTSEQVQCNDDVLPEWLGEVLNVYEKVTVGVRKG